MSHQRVIIGDNRTFGSLMNNEQDPSINQYIRQVAGQAMSRVSELGQRFVQRATEAYQSARESSAARLSAQVGRRIASMFQTNRVRQLRDTNDLQNAPDAMVRWLMANPSVRTLYGQQRCDGYSGRYKDIEPRKVGESHYDYRRVMNGILEEDGEEMVSRHYTEDLWVETDDLCLDDQAAILHSWDASNCAIAEGRDPTSRYDSALG